MHKNAIEKIRGIILGSLKRCEVVENWPQYESFSKHTDSLSKEILKHRSKWLTKNDVYSIYYDLVYESITDKTKSGPKFTGLLSELYEDNELDTLVNSLSNFYVSVPRKYSIYLPLPNISKNLGNSISLTDSIELKCFRDCREVPGGYLRGPLELSNDLKLNKVYLKIDLDGYCSHSLENKTVRSTLSSFKILIQQGLFKNLLITVEGQPAPLGLLGGLTHHQIPRSNIICIDSTDDNERVTFVELPIEISKLLSSIDFDWGIERVNKSLEEGNFEYLVKGYLRLPSLLIESHEPESRRIKSAIEWCFDSKANENETLSFLQICIGLESLLGDDEPSASLTETLADRCSYLVSSDIKGRSTIKEHFKELYRLRSKLVHGVESTIELDQKKYKHWGQVTLEFSIIKEIKHLNLK